MTTAVGGRRRLSRLHLTAPRWILVGAVLYLAWILEGLLLTTDLDPYATYISELAARDQPGSLLYRSTDALAGASVAVGAVLAACSPGLRRGTDVVTHRLWLVLWWTLIVFGLSTVADAMFPMECAVTGDIECTAAEVARELPWTHQVHTITSSVATAALLVAVIVAMPVARRVGWHYGAWLVAAAVLTLAGSLFLGWEMIAAQVEKFPAWQSLIGAAQRIQIVGASLWLIRVSRLLRLVQADAQSLSHTGAPSSPSTTTITSSTSSTSTTPTVSTARPSVVLAAGLGLPGRVWRPVCRFLDGRDVVVVDHASMRTEVSLEAEVSALSSHVPASGPVVVVGHSMWGLVAEAWARLHPTRVSGLVLLDSSVEHSPHPERGRLASMVAAGAGRLRLPRAQRLLSELAGYHRMAGDLAELRLTRPLPAAPVLVVVADRGSLRADAEWMERQRRLADRLARSHPWGAAGVRFEVVTPSSHLVMLDRPATVASLIQGVDSAQRPSSTDRPDDLLT